MGVVQLKPSLVGIKVSAEGFIFTGLIMKCVLWQRRWG
jgi:hypothetical protein